MSHLLLLSTGLQDHLQDLLSSSPVFLRLLLPIKLARSINSACFLTFLASDDPTFFDNTYSITACYLLYHSYQSVYFFRTLRPFASAAYTAALYPRATMLLHPNDKTVIPADRASFDVRRRFFIRSSPWPLQLQRRLRLTRRMSSSRRLPVTPKMTVKSLSLPNGIQQADKTGLSTMATFGLREDTGLVGQQYSWLTTVFYLTYMCFEFPSNILLQRWRMGKTLSIYMICWGAVVLCTGFAKNFKHLIALRALQGFFECCISPGFILIIGSWYTRREHSSRSLVFQSANAGFGVISDLTLYGIGTLEYGGKDIQAWRYMSYFLGSLTIAVGLLCLYFLGTPSEVPWLTKEEKRMANTRILENQSGHDRTGTKVWKWDQARECLVDPCFYFAGINAFLSSVPNGGLTTFGSIINTSFGFTSLQVILYTIPRSMTSVVIFVIVGLVTSKWKNLRLYIMAFATIPPFIGFLGMALIETSPSTKWTKWGMYYMTVPFVLSLFLGWTLIPSNLPGRTKRTVTSSFTFIGYRVGNMCGSQIFKTKDAPTYTPGVIGCSVCFGLEFLVIVAWRMTLVLRNRRRHKAMLTDGLTQEEREMQGKINGESDMTDFENPHFRYTL